MSATTTKLLAFDAPFLLLILDGFGYRKETQYNAIAQAHTPHLDLLWQKFPHTFLNCSGLDVGLPDAQMGNSEVGHMNIGAGRVVYQELTRINADIAHGQFFHHPIIAAAIHDAKTLNRRIHILGLVSPGGVHSHELHIHVLAQHLAHHDIKDFSIHAFLDGRDCPPQSAAASLHAMQQHLAQLQAGYISSISGRYYAMDRDQRWDRIEKVYNLLMGTDVCYHFHDALSALDAAYARGETDEFVYPSSITPSQDGNANPGIIQEGDIVFFMNFRADRARQLSAALVAPHFAGFQRKRIVQLQRFISLTEYDNADALPAEVLYPPQSQKNNLSEYLSQMHMQQLHIAETEKYAHVTFFFNGGREEPYPGETRILIPSPKVATYDLAPAMSAHELTDSLTQNILSKKYQFIVCNYANPDMLGHTGNLAATISAMEVIDECVGKILSALQAVGGECFITADHGNAELMFDENTQQPHTSHTCTPVPLFYVGRPAQFNTPEGSSSNLQHSQIGVLADIAPTILYLLNIPIPAEMTGRVLLTLDGRETC